MNIANTMNRLVVIFGLLLLGSRVGTADASILINITQSGSSVLFTTSGSLNMAGLRNNSDTGNSNFVYFNHEFAPGARQWIAFGSSGPDYYEGSADGLVDFTSNVSWSGGTGQGLSVDLVSGLANFGFRTGTVIGIWTPDNYASGTMVSQVLRRNNASFSSLGLNAGDFAEVSWTTATGSRESIRMQVSGISAVPEPSTIAMWSMLGLCGVGFVRRRKSAPANT